MLAVDQWAAIEEGLGPDWEAAKLSFSAEEARAVPESAAVLAPLGPGRVGPQLQFEVARLGGGPEKLRNLLGRLDDKRIWGSLVLLDAREASAPMLETDGLGPAPRARLADLWDRELAKLAPGWRDLLCELEVDSSDYVPRAALLGAPLNPTRRLDALALRFRVSDGGGYGTPPGMTRRCLERMDAEGITGRVTVLHGLADTDRAETQGPVWRIGGKSV
jgi:hypothetical protein